MIVDGARVVRAEDGSLLAIRKDARGHEYNDVALARQLNAQERGDQLRTTARAIVEKARSEIRTPETRSAVVVANTLNPEFGRTMAVVKIDGDPQDNPVAVVNKTGLALAPGDRVTVQFDPPHGISITGFAGDERLAASRVNWIVPFAYAGTITASVSQRYYPGDFGASCYYLIASLDTPGSTETKFWVLVNGLDVTDYTLEAGVDVIRVRLDEEIGCGPEAYYSVRIDTAGTDAADFNCQLFLRPGGDTTEGEGGGGIG